MSSQKRRGFHGDKRKRKSLSHTITIKLDSKSGEKVRAYLNPKSDKGKWLPFLNSNFGLWILGTVVVGLLSFSWQWYSSYLENRKIVTRIYLECSARTELAVKENLQIGARRKLATVDDKNILNILNNSLNQSEDLSGSVFDELSKLNFRGLMSYLFLIGGKRDKLFAENIVKEFVNVEKVVNTNVRNFDKKTDRINPGRSLTNMFTIFRKRQSLNFGFSE